MTDLLAQVKYALSNVCFARRCVTRGSWETSVTSTLVCFPLVSGNGSWRILSFFSRGLFVEMEMDILVVGFYNFVSSW